MPTRGFAVSSKAEPAKLNSREGKAGVETTSCLISARELQERLEEIVVADVRWYLDGRSGRAAYEKAHIPTAVFMDLDEDLSGSLTPGSGRHPLPKPEDFAETLERAGISNETLVVAYDDCGGMVAARLWWMLHVLGSRAAILNGGLQAWQGPLVSSDEETNRPAQGSFTARHWPEDCFVTTDEVEMMRGEDGSVLLDARSPERFRGEKNEIDTRFGHIPGAVNAPFAKNLSSDLGLLPPDELRRNYSAAGIEGDTPVVAYCGSGVSACLNLLALAHAGLREGRLFVGSWSAWEDDQSRPVETGSATLTAGGLDSRS